MPSVSDSNRSEMSPTAGVNEMILANGAKKRKRTSPTLSKAATPTPTFSRLRNDIGPTADVQVFPDGTTHLDSNENFASLGVQPWLVSSLAAMAITRPSGVQRGCIPKILEGMDCIGSSRTGSGKTVAFAVPILQKWAEDPVGIFAVVLTPTRYVGDHHEALLFPNC
jgi:ATP-dependent RNA helicase DDX49/DBP8